MIKNLRNTDLIIIISIASIIILYNIILNEVYNMFYIVILGLGIIILILIYIFRYHLKGFL